ncbi:MAG: aldehyde dehydrogenase family protein [Verrucomicrobiota bacterium]|nr:aldehyde dehydrogenase family protein [Verrucomicrobiota bacterium]MDQ6938721.1 aldehyde dehydrogenase family protein [Verrucomicrobiota bacterium]
MSAIIELSIAPSVNSHSQMRAAQKKWALTSIRDRSHVVRKLRHLIAKKLELLAEAAAAVNRRPIAEKLVSEVLPLADACRWLERNAVRVLAARRHGKRGQPLWLRGLSFEVQRQPFGCVLVIGPGNYPLFLPAVHTLHALLAGNAVLLKPAPGTRAVALAFAQLAFDSGLDSDLLTVLPEGIESAKDAIAAGVDKVVFTGSSENGRDLLAALAESNTPAVMELSGEDAMLVLADADLNLVARAVRFGLRLNGGETCIAPQRLIVMESVADDLRRCLHEDISIERVSSEEAAIACVNASEFGLGAAIFSRDITKARDIAARLKTGFVVINDLIVPTADPRMPFGGVKASGFGSTRGEEGLLEMTFPHVVTVRRGGTHPHFDEATADDADFFASYIRAVHGRDRFGAWREFFVALRKKIRVTKS